MDSTVPSNADNASYSSVDDDDDDDEWKELFGHLRFDYQSTHIFGVDQTQTHPTYSNSNIITHELKEGGSNIPVTLENR
jgi:hypothetical protein